MQPTPAQPATTPRTKGRPPAGPKWLPVSLQGYQKSWLAPDIVAGVTLAAVSIPECMGYTKIAGMPVATGLYTILLPILAFALLGSSRYLVVGADSATAAILFAGLTGIAQPDSPQWVMLAGTAAFLAAGLLFLASLLRLGFLADFLSRTVLVGFLSGVGVSLMLGQLPDMLHVHSAGKNALTAFIGIVRAAPHAHLPTLLMSLGVLAVILILERCGKQIPGALVAVVLAIGTTAMFHLDRLGLSVVGSVPPGLPSLGLPHVSVAQAMRLLPMATTMFLVILAQSAATSRSFAQKHGDALDENRDLVALGAANLLAGLSRTFIVNGSPTKTAIVDSAGGRTQVAQMVTAGLTLCVLLFATSLIAWLPSAALAALVFLIGVRLVDVRSLRDILRFRGPTFAVAMAALAGVVFLGVQRGIFFAIALSVVDHLRQEYKPKDVVLTMSGAHWSALKAAAGIESAPGLLVYRFEAPLFFANADYFAQRVKAMAGGTPNPLKWLLLDLVSMSDIDYTGGLRLRDTVKDVQAMGIHVAFVQADDVREQMDRLGITEIVGPERIYGQLADAVAALDPSA